MSWLRKESDWTDPTDRCPHPEWWTAVDAESAELEVAELVRAFVRALQPDYVIETGTARGVTASAIGEALTLNGHGHLDTLETDWVRCEGVRSTLETMGVSEVVTVHNTDSLLFDPVATIGFAWIDSDPSIRIAEFHRFRPSMRSGTIVGFHDTAAHFGVYGEQAASLPGTRAISLPTPRGVTFVEVL